MITKSVFLSHSSKDEGFCDQLFERLQEADIEIWYDKHFLKGQELNEKLHSEIQHCDYFLVVLSPTAVQSTWVRQECVWAHEADKKIIITVAVELTEADKAELLPFMNMNSLQWATSYAQGIQPTTRRVLDFLGLIPRPTLLRLFGHNHQKQGTIALEPGYQICLYIDPMDSGQLHFTLGGTGHVRERYYIVVQRMKGNSAPCRWTFIEEPMVPSKFVMELQYNGHIVEPQTAANWVTLDNNDHFDMQLSLSEITKEMIIKNSNNLFLHNTIPNFDIADKSGGYSIEYHGYENGF